MSSWARSEGDHPRLQGRSTLRPWILRIRPQDHDLKGALERAVRAGRLSPAQCEPLRRRPTSWSPEGAARKLAVFVTHGMGQQLPFESAATVAEGLIAHNPQFAGELVPLTACNARSASGRRQHLSFQARDTAGAPVEIHVHEGYWAPLTEGRVHLLDVLRFLYSGAFNSLRTWRFTRYMFGRTVVCKLPPLGHLRMVMTTLILSFFVLFNFVVACTLVGLVLREGFNLQALTWPSDELVEVMNRIVALFLSTTALFAVLIWLPSSFKKRLRAAGWWGSSRVRWCWHRAADVAQWGAWAWYGSTLVCLVLMLTAMVGEQRNPQVFGNWAATVDDWPVRVEAPFWLLLFVAFGFMRRKLVQYMGDVAAYVSPHVLDRFMNIRQDIKRWVFDAAQHVYQCQRADGSYEYDGIVLIGHSLGSVVIYDTLNALLNDDEAAGRPMRVAERTRLLLTFGSPLDKTAYIFSRHRQPFAETRGLMAAAVQPLICGYETTRRVPWVNVHSPRDPVCDPLCFYDDPLAHGHEARHVRNVVDCDARMPLTAHREYWDNACIYEQVWQGLGVTLASPAHSFAPKQHGAESSTSPHPKTRTRVGPEPG